MAKEFKAELLPADPAAAERRAAEDAARKAELERTGGPVQGSSVLGCTVAPGLTVLDHFAAQALPGCIAYAYAEKFCDPVAIAEHAYELAAAMIELRRQAVSRG